ncbi:MAG: hypothetical protein AB7S41_10360 [Parvibaculaceae bacterium]
MDEKRRSSVLALSGIAGALTLAVLQVGWIVLADPPKTDGQDVVRSQARGPDVPERETRFLPARSYPRS